MTIWSGLFAVLNTFALECSLKYRHICSLDSLLMPVLNNRVKCHCNRPHSTEHIRVFFIVFSLRVNETKMKTFISTNTLKSENTNEIWINFSGFFCCCALKSALNRVPNFNDVKVCVIYWLLYCRRFDAPVRFTANVHLALNPFQR